MASREQMVEKVAAVEWKNDIGEAWPPVDADNDVAENYRRHALSVLDAILPQVTTVAELEALPHGSVVLTAAGQPFVLRSRARFDYTWIKVNEVNLTNREHKDSVRFRDFDFDADGPLTVVWQPEVTA
jgi:hypothetical protein